MFVKDLLRDGEKNEGSHVKVRNVLCFNLKIIYWKKIRRMVKMCYVTDSLLLCQLLLHLRGQSRSKRRSKREINSARGGGFLAHIK